MSLARYTKKKFRIANEYNPQFSDGHDGDCLTIVEDPLLSGAVKFNYAIAVGSVYRGSWAYAVGIYDDRRDIITGSIQVTPEQGEAVTGWFSIALDRDPAYSDRKSRIHVYVQIKSGPPDEGSFTGQGN